MLNVSEVITSPDFARPYRILRSSGGKFDLGGWVEGRPVVIDTGGTVTVATEQELSQVPEGDRVTGSLVFYNVNPIYLTHAKPTPGLSDVIEYRGETYRVMTVFPYVDYGYYKAVAVRMSGA